MNLSLVPTNRIDMNLTTIDLPKEMISGSKEMLCDWLPLSQAPTIPNNCNNAAQEDQASYTEVDGQRAWTFLLGAFVIEGLMWGFPMTFGIFRLYYQQNQTFQSNNLLSFLGILSIAIPYLGAPFASFYINSYPQHMKFMLWFGWIICLLSLSISSFATQIWHLILTQGLGYGIGFVVLYYPVLQMLNRWFYKRRGLAYGILSCSSAISGLGLPIATSKLLQTFGYPTTLRIWCGIILVIISPIIVLLQTYSPQTYKNDRNIISFEVLSDPAFVIISFSNILQSLVFFIPNVWLPLYATKLGLRLIDGTILLSVLSISQIIGLTTMGFLSDRYKPTLLMITSTFCSMVVVFCIWNPVQSMSSMVLFAVFYGLVAGGYSVLYPRLAVMLTSYSSRELWLFSIFEFQRGFGSVIGGVVSDYLGDQALILFIGLAYTLSTVFGMACWLFQQVSLYKRFQKHRKQNSGAV